MNKSDLHEADSGKALSPHTGSQYSLVVEKAEPLGEVGSSDTADLSRGVGSSSGVDSSGKAGLLGGMAARRTSATWGTVVRWEH